MSKPTYHAEDVIAELDRWHNEMMWNATYKFEPIENVKERGKKTDKVATCEFSERVCHLEQKMKTEQKLQ